MTPGWRRGTLRSAATPTPFTVVKLGGSLLTRIGWAADVAALLDSLSAPRLLVVGGGPLVDGLRAIDEAAPTPADLMHHLAIECMGHTARLVSTALGVPLVAEAHPVPETTAVLDAPAWLARDGRLDALPVGWQVTSDSIAATVAAAHGLPLVLVKSAPPPHDDIERLAALGWVDAWFPTAALPLAHITWAAPA